MKASHVLFLVFVIMMSLWVVTTQPVKPQSSGTIYIRSDGTVEGTDKIQRDGNVYTFIDNIVNQSVVVERDDIVVDGGGYTIQYGFDMRRGLTLNQVNNVTIINAVVKETGDPQQSGSGIYLRTTTNSIIANNTVTKNVYGIFVAGSSGNIIAGNNVTSNYSCGIFLSCGNNTIIGNCITANGGQHIMGTAVWAVGGIYFTCSSKHTTLNNTVVGNQITENAIGIHFMSTNYFGSRFTDNLIYHNNFIDNAQSVINEAIVSTILVNIWDNGSRGNYWSDYTGNDTNLDGIGDIPYVIDAKNQDNYPLMAPIDISSIELPELPGAPSVFLVSPENKTYDTASVPLNFTVSKQTSWIGYSLDGQENVTVTENTTLTGLSNGLHNLTVYANDTFGYTGTSETIYFRVSQPEPFPTWIIAAMVIITIVGAALLVYFRKIRKTTEKAETQFVRE